MKCVRGGSVHPRVACLFLLIRDIMRVAYLSCAKMNSRAARMLNASCFTKSKSNRSRLLLITLSIWEVGRR